MQMVKYKFCQTLWKSGNNMVFLKIVSCLCRKKFSKRYLLLNYLRFIGEHPTINFMSNSYLLRSWDILKSYNLVFLDKDEPYCAQ